MMFFNYEVAHFAVVLTKDPRKMMRSDLGPDQEKALGAGRASELTELFMLYQVDGRNRLVPPAREWHSIIHSLPIPELLTLLVEQIENDGVSFEDLPVDIAIGYLLIARDKRSRNVVYVDVNRDREIGTKVYTHWLNFGAKDSLPRMPF